MRHGQRVLDDSVVTSRMEEERERRKERKAKYGLVPPGPEEKGFKTFGDVLCILVACLYSFISKTENPKKKVAAALAKLATPEMGKKNHRTLCR